MWNEIVRKDTWVMNLPNGVLIRTVNHKEIGQYSSNYGSVSIAETMQFVPDIYWDLEAKVFMPIEVLPDKDET